MVNLDGFEGQGKEHRLYFVGNESSKKLSYILGLS